VSSIPATTHSWSPRRTIKPTSGTVGGARHSLLPSGEAKQETFGLHRPFFPPRPRRNGSGSGQGVRDEAVRSSSRYSILAADQTCVSGQTLLASTGVRLECVSEWSQRHRALTEHRKDGPLVARAEPDFVPVRVEGKADLVGQHSLTGALKPTRKYRDGSRGHKHAGDPHRASLLPFVVSQQTIPPRPEPLGPPHSSSRSRTPRSSSTPAGGSSSAARMVSRSAISRASMRTSRLGAAPSEGPSPRRATPLGALGERSPVRD